MFVRPNVRAQITGSAMQTLPGAPPALMQRREKVVKSLNLSSRTIVIAGAERSALEQGAAEQCEALYLEAWRARH